MGSRGAPHSSDIGPYIPPLLPPSSQPSQFLEMMLIQVAAKAGPDNQNLNLDLPVTTAQALLPFLFSVSSGPVSSPGLHPQIRCNQIPTV